MANGLLLALSAILGASAVKASEERLDDNEGWIVQTVIFERESYSVLQAIRWLEEKGLEHNKVDTIGNYHRFRQANPGLCVESSYSTVDVDEGVKAIFCRSLLG